MESSYSFTTQQRSRAKGGGAFSHDDPMNTSVNIMFDKRVVRGSTYSKRYRASAEKQNSKQQRTRRAKNPRHETHQSNNNSGREHDGVEAIPGHQHNTVQTETYLEVLSDKIVEVHGSTQTDNIADAPEQPLFMPTNDGIDVGTQVDVEELFDFDLEVEPLLQVLVGKTLHHALLEVLEEEELKHIRHQQAMFEQTRNIELAEVQRLEAEAIRLQQERVRRVEQQQSNTMREKKVAAKVAARAFAKECTKELNDRMFEKLLASGKLHDPLVKEVEEVFIPWLLTEASNLAEQKIRAQELLDLMITDVVNKLST